MTKQAGLGQRLLVGGYDISGDIQTLSSVQGMTALGDVTDITQSAHSRLGLLRDGSMAASAFFDAANAHPVLSALPTADVGVSYLLGTTLAAPAACIVAKQVGYDPNRAASGELTLKTEFKANGYGIGWGEQLTAGLRTDTTATAGAYYDDGAGSAFGGQAWLQVTAFTGTSVTVTIEHCTTSGGTYAGVLAFSAVSAAPAWQRIAVSNTTAIDRYLMVVTTGTFTNAVFSVVFQRFTVAGVTF